MCVVFAMVEHKKMKLSQFVEQNGEQKQLKQQFLFWELSKG